MIQQVATLFFLANGMGTLWFVGFLSPTYTGEGFPRLISLFFVVNFLLFCYLDPFPIPLSPWGPLLLLFFLFLWNMKHHSLLLFLIHGPLLVIGHEVTGSSWHSLLGFLLSAMILGPLAYAMLLGHWYLVTPKLSERPLIMALRVGIVGLVLKAIYTIIVFGLIGLEPFYSTFDIILLSMKFLWGYMALGVLSYFAHRLIAMRSLQSATGLLYVMVFFTLVSELISFYFYFHQGYFL